MSQKLRQKLNQLWLIFKNELIKFLKGELIKLALKKFLGSAAASGFKAWIVKFIVTELYEEIAEPIIRAGLVEIGYVKDVIEGKITVEKIEKARENGDENAYNDAVDSIFH